MMYGIWIDLFSGRDFAIFERAENCERIYVNSVSCRGGKIISEVQGVTE